MVSEARRELISPVSSFASLRIKQFSNFIPHRIDQSRRMIFFLRLASRRFLDICAVIEPFLPMYFIRNSSSARNLFSCSYQRLTVHFGFRPIRSCTHQLLPQERKINPFAFDFANPITFGTFGIMEIKLRLVIAGRQRRVFQTEIIVAVGLAGDDAGDAADGFFLWFVHRRFCQNH